MDYTTLDNGTKVLTAPPVGSGGTVLNHNFGLLDETIGKVARSHYQHEQPSAATVWTITHNLGRFPASVTVLDLDGTVSVADVQHVSTSTLVIRFTVAHAGRAVMS